MTFCVPTTFVRSALSNVGLNVTLPAELITTSISFASAWASSSVKPRLSSAMSPPTMATLSRMNSSKAAPYLSRTGSKGGALITLFQKRVSDSSCDRARTVTYTRPMFGNRCSNMLSVTLPRNPVPPIRNILRPLKISVGESFVLMIIESRSLVSRRSASALQLTHHRFA